MRTHTSIGTLLFLIVVSGVPVARGASEWDMLRVDIDAWTDEEFWIDADRKEEEEDLALERAQNPFPAALQRSSSSGEMLRERTDAFLHVTVDRKDIAFHDIPRAAWFAPYVRSIAERNIMSGYKDADGRLLGEFRPGNPVTLEEVAKTAVQSAEINVKSCSGTAKNLSASGSWSQPFVSCAEREQWSVFSDGGVDVRRPAKRSEVVVTLLQALRVPITPAQGSIFADVSLATEFAAAIERAALDGMVSGDDASGPKKFFRSMDSMNRAELAKVVTLGLQLYK